MSKRPVPLFTRKVAPRKPNERQTATNPSFSFDFDDTTPTPTPLTGSALINSVLDSSNGSDISLSSAQVKLRVGPTNRENVSPQPQHHEQSSLKSSTSLLVPNDTIQMMDDDNGCHNNNSDNNENNNNIELTPSNVITFHHPSTLYTAPILYPTHIAPKTTPGTHVIYATTLPQSSLTLKKRSIPTKNASKTNTKIAQNGNNSNNTDTILNSSLEGGNKIEYVPIPEPYLPITTNHIPKWVLGIDPLLADDFECPLSSLPDLMIDADGYMLSLPNPTDKVRNIFVSVAAPLRCVTGSGVVLESAICTRKFRKYEDRYLISNITGKPIIDANITPSTTKSNDNDTSMNNGTNNVIKPHNNSHNNKSIKKQEQTWSDPQLIIQTPSPHMQYGIDNGENDIKNNVPYFNAQKYQPGESILTESTTFAVVIPPNSVIDLCHIVTTAHTHNTHNIITNDSSNNTTTSNTTQNNLTSSTTTTVNHKKSLSYSLSSYIHTQDYSNLSSDEFIQRFNSFNYPPAQLPLSCPNLIKDMCSQDMPLDLAQRYMYNHITSDNTQNNEIKLPPFIPILSSPLPPVPYLISQSFCGLLTHHMPQTRYAVDLLCVNGTPVYSPIDAIIFDLDNKSCSIGNHASNLFDWNSVSLCGYVDDAIVPFMKSVGGAIDNNNNNNKNDETKLLQPTPRLDTTISTKHNISPIDTKQFNEKIYIDLVHLSTIIVRKGQIVKKGQLIGYTGSTGFAPSPHLHMQVSLSSDSNAYTIPFAFSVCNSTISGTNTITQQQHSTSPSSPIKNSSLITSVLPEAGYALTPSGLISSDNYKLMFNTAVQYHSLLNNLPLPPPPAVVVPTLTSAQSLLQKQSAAKTALGKGKIPAKKTTTTPAQKTSTSCCGIDSYHISSIPLTNGQNAVDFPFHTAMEIAHFIGAPQ